MTSILPSLIHPTCHLALTRVLNRSSAFAIFMHTPTCDAIVVDYEAAPHEDCMSLWKHERLRGGGGKFLVVDVGRGRVRGRFGKEGEEEGVVELGLGGKGEGEGVGKGLREGVVFLQWRRQGGSVGSEMALERDYEPLRQAFGLQKHARFCDWWMLDGWDSILRYTGFEKEAYKVRYGGV